LTIEVIGTDLFRGSFSLGSMVTSTLALMIIPSRSCPESGDDPCDVKTENTGWRILLYVLGGLTLFFFLCRIAFFKLHESPKYVRNLFSKALSEP
jgi:hypothetical protein